MLQSESQSYTEQKARKKKCRLDAKNIERYFHKILGKENTAKNRPSLDDVTEALVRLENLSMTTQHPKHFMLDQLHAEFPRWQISDYDAKKLISLVS